jgi:hypothetical protein
MKAAGKPSSLFIQAALSWSVGIGLFEIGVSASLDCLNRLQGISD